MGTHKSEVESFQLKSDAESRPKGMVLLLLILGIIESWGLLNSYPNAITI